MRRAVARTCVGAALLLTAEASVFAQFSRRAGDTVIYVVTAGGAGDLRVHPPSATNTAATLSAFQITSLASVPIQKSTPFPIDRQVLFERPNETFAVGTDYENTIGLHRTFLYPVKVLQIEGFLNPYGNIVGGANTFINFPKGLDVEGDIALETEVIVVWFPATAPFIVPATQRGSVGPPDISGFEYLFQMPGGIGFPSLMPWTPLRVLYPGAGWPSGVEQKMLDVDISVGTTIRQIRIRAGAQTPRFSTAGHTHLFVLQGNVTVSPAGAKPSAFAKYDYAYLPEGMVVSLANPAAYSGPRAR